MNCLSKVAPSRLRPAQQRGARAQGTTWRSCRWTPRSGSCCCWARRWAAWAPASPSAPASATAAPLPAALSSRTLPRAPRLRWPRLVRPSEECSVAATTPLPEQVRAGMWAHTYGDANVLRRYLGSTPQHGPSLGCHFNLGPVIVHGRIVCQCTARPPRRRVATDGALLTRTKAALGEAPGLMSADTGCAVRTLCRARRLRDARGRAAVGPPGHGGRRGGLGGRARAGAPAQRCAAHSFTPCLPAPCCSPSS